MSQILRTPLRVVFYRDDSDRSVWVAHCLEFDLVGHGGTQKDAFEMLTQAISIQVVETLKSGNLNNLFSPAPSEYQVMYAKGRDVVEAGMKLQAINTNELEIDGTDAREYDDGYSNCGAGDLAMA